MTRLLATSIILLILSSSMMILVVPQAAVGQQQPQQPQPTGDSVATGYDYKHTGFNPQTVINKDNVKNLEFKWVYQLPSNPYRNILQPSLGLETNPLVVNGVVYFAASYSKVFAVNAATGILLWSHEVNVTKALQKPYIGNFGVQHAIVYKDGLIYQLAIDCTLYGLDASNGKVKLQIDDICKDVPGNRGLYFGEEAPTIYEKDGRKIAIVPVAAGLFYARGFVAAYDLQTKELLWRWFVIPPDVEGSKDSWEGYKDVSKGNIKLYPGDWGNSSEIWGGSAWVSSSIDEDTNTVYTSTGYPGIGLTLAGNGDASRRPGPNLYTNSIVALDVLSGKMKWYYQVTPHDVTQHGFGWNTILAKVTVDGKEKKVIVTGSKNGYVYELDAETGQPLIQPVKVGTHLNDYNTNKGNDADMTMNQQQGVSCPGGNGGIESPVAVAHNTIFAAAQNRCFDWRPVPNAYKGSTVWVAGPVMDRPQNSTLYAIDATSGSIKWQYNMPNPYQGAGIIVSGGVVYAQDRIGTLYMLDEQNGQLLRTISFGGLGAAGVAIGQNPRGVTMLFVPSGGGDIIVPTPGTLTAFALREDGSSDGGGTFTDEVVYIAIAVAIVMGGIALVSLRRKSVK
ncbi:MAG: PQQ-binding-like beta-propeller repeat protein [Thaumarchaeota archaeon]|nr:PQQ-binding-like beta-propeller repeat protein [Nitrososphaerota archaeon]MCL5316824.1 PQQ-binding-like beta-propeller repeat protein [Nitrososphaerota archaeon]